MKSRSPKPRAAESKALNPRQKLVIVITITTIIIATVITTVIAIITTIVIATVITVLIILK